MKQKIKNVILKIPSLKKMYTNSKVKTGSLIRELDLKLFIDKANKIFLDTPIKHDILVGLVKDGNTSIEGFLTTRAYSPKYERFLINNNINYAFYDIYASNWIEEAEKFDIIIWYIYSDPATQQMAKSKLYFLDKIMKKVCFPSFDEIWTYEEKINTHYLFQFYNLPEIPTFISFSKSESINYIEHAQFPLISKITTGSYSYGVEIVKTKKQAKKIINNIFDLKGRKTYWPYQRQKNYVYFQKFVPDAGYDLRVMVVGNKLFGYYRLPNKGDFRASGAGNVTKKEIPTEALELAYRTKQAFKTTFLATDMLFDEMEKKYLIIESSIFIRIDTCEQLVIDGKPGYYHRITENNYQFKGGRYWIQELVLEELFKKLQ